MGEVKPETVNEAIARYEIDAERPSPTSQALDAILRGDRQATAAGPAGAEGSERLERSDSPEESEGSEQS
jgi:hypothetical protein